MRRNEKRILRDYSIANIESGSQRRANIGCGAFEKSAVAVSSGAETVRTRSANRAAVLIGTDTYETDEWRDVGGEA